MPQGKGTIGGMIVVVGGGVIGVASAYYLAKRGLPVTLLEKGDIASGASAGNAGLVVPSHSVPLAAPGVLSKGLRWMLDPESPFYVRPRASLALARWLLAFAASCTEAHVRRAAPVIKSLHYASLDLYRELAMTPGLDFGFEERGILEVYRTARGLEEGRGEAARLAEAGIDARVFDAEATMAFEPALAPGVAGGLHVAADAQIVPDRFVTGLARLAAASHGVRVRTGVEVTGFRRDRGRVTAVRTAEGDVACEGAVVATGAWSPALGRDLGVRVPVEAAKGYSLTGPVPAGGPSRPLMLAEAKVAVTPMGDRLRYAGTLELAGVDLSISPRRVEAIRRAARTYLRDPGAPLAAEPWAGLRPCSPDGLPIVGRAPGLDNVVLATGHAMIGVSLGPITGKLVSEIVAGAPSSLDVQPLSPARFA